MNKLLLLGALLGTLTFGVGCQPASEPEMHQGRSDATTTSASGAPTSAVTGLPSAAPSGETPAGMMTQDPRSITEVDGTVVKVEATELLVNKGSVTLKFHLTPKTVVKPAGKKLAENENVKILIDQVSDGMAAREVDIK